MTAPSSRPRVSKRAAEAGLRKLLRETETLRKATQEPGGIAPHLWTVRAVEKLKELCRQVCADAQTSGIIDSRQREAMDGYVECVDLDNLTFNTGRVVSSNLEEFLNTVHLFTEAVLGLLELKRQRLRQQRGFASDG